MIYVLKPAGGKCLEEEIALYFLLINFSSMCVWSCVFLFQPFAAVFSFAFVYIKKDIISKLDKSSAQMENSHHFPAKVNSGEVVFTRVVQTKGPG